MVAAGTLGALHERIEARIVPIQEWRFSHAFGSHAGQQIIHITIKASPAGNMRWPLTAVALPVGA
jgi:hypothetical protein